MIGNNKLSESHEFKTQLSASKFMRSVFWDSKGANHIYFLPYGITINAQYYNNSLHNDVHQMIWWKSWETVKDHPAV
jgi:hypothetical protein